MARTQRRPVEDFEAILRAISSQKGVVILVGGHAVNVWALSYHDRLGDVLRSVNGLPKLDAHSAISLEVCGHAVPVLFPHLLIQAKLENAFRLDQRERQDVKHVKIMALVLREFLLDVVTTASVENEKPALQLLRNVLAVLTSDNAREFTRRHRLTLIDIMPVEALQSSPLRKLANFGQKELPRAITRG